MREKTGFSTTTYRIKLYKKHLDWLELTKEYYNLVLKFYYELLYQKQEILELSNQEVMRQLEVMTVGSKRKEHISPIYPIPYEKVPLYFRRAAINSAISLMRSYSSKYENWKENKEKSEPMPTRYFHSSPVYYKGMYKEFTQESIMLKLWNGENWKWVKYKYDSCGHKFNENQIRLSPTIKITSKQCMLHIPVVTPVSDIRTITERIKDKEKLCAVAVPGNDCLAVCAVFDKNGRNYDTYFIHGGNELKHYKKRLLGKIAKNRFNMGQLDYNKEDNKRYKVKIHHLTDYYAHMASRKIIDYCLENEIKIIAVPFYEAPINFKTKAYLKTTNYDWIGRRIISYIKYKAFQAGIVVGTVRPHYLSSTCHICKEPIKKYNDGYSPNKNFYGGKQFLCPNGHKGNTAWNTAMNIGISFETKYGMEKELTERT